MWKWFHFYSNSRAVTGFRKVDVSALAFYGWFTTEQQQRRKIMKKQDTTGESAGRTHAVKLFAVSTIYL